ncbi:MAG: VWA domain-containing protein [Planctomycetota bacterium]
MEGFRFCSPLWFILAPLALAVVWWSWHPGRRAAVVFSSLADLKTLPVTTAQRVRRLLPWAYGVGLLLLVAALARPQQGKSEARLHTEGIAIEMVVDVSGSMEALDYEINGEPASRVSAVKHVFREFVLGSKSSGLHGRPNDLIGLVAFGTYADSQCPLTLDHGALADIAESLGPAKPIRDRRGNLINKDWREEDNTAIGDGLTLALDRLRNITAKSKVEILLTDGGDNASVVEPHEAAKMAQKLGVKIYTIGFGHPGIVPFPQEDDFGHRVLVQAQFPLDERLLREIAETTSGQFFYADSTKKLEEIYAQIDQMEKSKVEETQYTEYTELYLWLAAPGLALLMVAGFLGATRFRALP